MKIAIIIILSMMVMACSQKSDVLGVKVGEEYYALDHASKEAVVNNINEEKLICRKTMRTGSHLKVKRCTTVKQLAIERSKSNEVREDRSIFLTRKYVDGVK